MATLSTVLAFSRAQSQTDSNGLTDTNGIIFGNEALIDFRRRLQTAGIDASQTQEAYTSIVANQGTYLYPTDMARLKTISVNYADQTASNYLQASQVDASNLPDQTSFLWLRANAQPTAPFFDDRGDQFEIFPTPTKANSQGIRIFYFLEPTEFIATTDTVSYPESLDYRIIGWRIAYSYLKSLMKIDEANDFLKEYEMRVRQLIESLGQGTQSPIQPTTIPWTGWQF